MVVVVVEVPPVEEAILEAVLVLREVVEGSPADLRRAAFFVVLPLVVVPALEAVAAAFVAAADFDFDLDAALDVVVAGACMVSCSRLS